MIKVYSEGITKYISENEWQRYRELGFTKVEETKKVETAEEPEEPKTKKGKKAE